MTTPDDFAGLFALRPADFLRAAPDPGDRPEAEIIPIQEPPSVQEAP